ncbi:glutathione S-transferase N-terminal domain-containing protein [Epibacterium sp. MM17-32]|uniref:glutathione S-transferase N-terminal domain-containing protein n=1 Tax=Epibacterium sp. MM17-32 TaxID=2917734 RepID=UPI001EF69E50|nr:glutathione S-transferase N-terminal domain-containing protein [Epibacterium sp. MM17-32]MCG7629995.1 glutathione S-transferase N-terminal domain-containing protein [Epibacterium sp. MM17-32]
MRTLYSLCGKAGESYSPHVWKVIMALHHKQLDFAIEPVDFSTIKGIEGGAFNSVPVLRDGDRVLGDSFDICEYLEEAYPDAPRLFEGDGGRRMARFFETYCLTMLHPPLSVIVAMDMYNVMSESDQAYFRAKREERFGVSLETLAERGDSEREVLTERLVPLRKTLEDQPWICGDKPLFPDYIVFGTLQWCWVVGARDLLDKDDPVQRWFSRCQDLFGAAARDGLAA